MSDYTKPYPILNREQIQGLRRLVPAEAAETDFCGPGAVCDWTDFTTGSAVRAAVRAVIPDILKLGGCVVMTILASAVPCGIADTSARGMEVYRASSAECPIGRRRRKREAAADLLEPLTFNWTPADYDVTKAVKTFTESLYAHP
jgi:hypothetical protein